jgi:hypothetical protein
MITDICGMRVYSNPYMVEQKEVEETFTLSWQERWLHPLLHPATVPFEPWVKEVKRMVTYTIPMAQALRVNGNDLIVHPAMLADLRRVLEELHANHQ